MHPLAWNETRYQHQDQNNNNHNKDHTPNDNQHIMTSLDKIKLHFPEWDADRNPSTHDYINFRNQFENMVDAIDAGYDLINFVLYTQGRERVTAALVPSSLQGAMWQDDDSDMDSDDDSGKAPQITSYKQLSKKSKELDTMLFPLLQRSIKGTKNALLDNT